MKHFQNKILFFSLNVFPKSFKSKLFQISKPSIRQIQPDSKNLKELSDIYSMPSKPTQSTINEQIHYPLANKTNENESLSSPNTFRITNSKFYGEKPVKQETEPSARRAIINDVINLSPSVVKRKRCNSNESDSGKSNNPLIKSPYIQNTSNNGIALNKRNCLNPNTPNIKNDPKYDQENQENSGSIKTWNRNNSMNKSCGKG